MTAGPLRVVFMGGDAFGVPIARTLTSGTVGPDRLSVDVVGVVTGPDRPAGRGRPIAVPPVKQLAVERSIPVLQPARIRDPAQLEPIVDLAPDLIVVASYGQIIPRKLLETARYGCLNLHPSLLPRHRGPSPIAGAILAGDKMTGATLMLMNERMDEGPLLAQERTSIGGLETAGELAERLSLLSESLFARHLAPWIRGDISPAAQHHADATYTRLLRKQDGLISWDRPAEHISLQVRALNPWPVAFTAWQGRLLRLLRAGFADGREQPGSVISVGEGGAVVGTGDGVLVIHELQLAGSRPLEPSAFVRGHREFVGAVLG